MLESSIRKRRDARFQIIPIWLAWHSFVVKMRIYKLNFEYHFVSIVVQVLAGPGDIIHFSTWDPWIVRTQILWFSPFFVTGIYLIPIKY